MSAITGTKNNNLIQRHIIQRLNELIHESTENWLELSNNWESL